MAREGKGRRIDTGGGGKLADNPFEGLSAVGLPEAGPRPGKTERAALHAQSAKRRGRVEVRRERKGRGGKEVTVLSGEGFQQVHPGFLEELLRQLKGRSGCGGALKDRTIELQGDRRDFAVQALRGAGFRPVRAGG